MSKADDIQEHEGSNETLVDVGDQVIVDFDPGCFGGMGFPIGGLQFREKVIGVGVFRESGINDSLKKFGHVAEMIADIANSKYSYSSTITVRYFRRSSLTSYASYYIAPVSFPWPILLKLKHVYHQ